MSTSQYPECFICVIHHGLLVDPVVTRCGHSFCRACIERWMEYSETCPHCREAVCYGTLVCNFVLREAMEEILGLSGIGYHKESERSTPLVFCGNSDEIDHLGSRIKILNSILEPFVASFSAEEMFFKGLNSYKRHQYQKAVFWYEKAAHAGYVQAMVDLADCFRDGEGVQQDLQQAVLWLQKSAQAGHSGAMVSLGYCYSFGKGVEQNLEQAFLYYQRAAHLGNRDAMYNLSLAYELGEGVVRDEQMAFQWYNRCYL
ncbi:hypothetical protein P9112_009683 [Eukaryota sp. TZLM1-RC]